MKKTLLATLAVMTAFMVSCEPEESNTATVSFVSPVASWNDGVATVQIAVSGYTGDAVSIPVVYGGTAELGVDYTVSSEAFVVGGANPVLEIAITPTEEGASKSITMTLTAPSGFTIGQIPMCQVDMEGFLGYASFTNATATLKGSLDVEIRMYDASGSSLDLETAATIEVEVDESSTAVEGEHFEFEGDETGALIDAGEDSGVLTVNFLKFEEGHDKLVLRIKETSRFSGGQNSSIEITLTGPDWDNISGKWTMNEIVTDAVYFVGAGTEENTGMWGTMVNVEGLPEFNANDAVTINTETLKFTPDFESAFSNFFIGESNMTRGEEYFLRTGLYGEGQLLQLITLDNVNRYFTEGNVSANKTALVGVQIILDENGEELLDMYIIDYEPHSFLKELVEYELITGTPPMATMSGCYLNMTFKRAE